MTRNSPKVKTKKFQTQKNKKISTKKKTKKERHDDKTSTNDRFKIQKNIHKKKDKKKETKKNGTTTKHPQMVASKQTPLWLFWDI